MENVKQQQDKIMKTASYRPVVREAVDSAHSAAHEATPSSAEGGESAVVAHNTAFLSKKRVGEHSMSMQHVHANPQVVSYKELIERGAEEEMKDLEKVRKIVFEIKKNAKLGGEIMRGFVHRNANIGRNCPLEAEDSRCLINLSNLFYDNLYKEEIKSSPLKQSYFVLAF